MLYGRERRWSAVGNDGVRARLRTNDWTACWAHLHKAFVEAGWPSPSEIIRREQLRLVVRLLRDGRLSIPEVMDRAGFVSQSHFSTFIRKKMGRTPCDIRRGQQIPRNAWTPVRTKASIGLSEH